MESWGQPWTSGVCSVAETHWWVVSLYRCMQHVIAAEEMGNSDSVIPILGSFWSSNYGSVWPVYKLLYWVHYMSRTIAVPSHSLREWLVLCHIQNKLGHFPKWSHTHQGQTRSEFSAFIAPGCKLLLLAPWTFWLSEASSRHQELTSQLDPVRPAWVYGRRVLSIQPTGPCMRSVLNKYSMLCGRNPLVSCEFVQVHATCDSLSKP